MCRITMQHLIDAGACREAKIRFRELFGESVEVTEEAAAAVAREFNWNWAAVNLLSEPARATYWRVSRVSLEKYLLARHVAEVEGRGFVAEWTEYRRVAATCFARLYMDTWPRGDDAR